MKTAALSELADMQYGFPFDSKHFVKEGEMRIVRIRDIKKPEQPTYFDGDYDEAYVIQNGDIIVGMDGEFNSTLWEHGPALLNQRIARVLPKNSVSKVYLYYMLRLRLKEEEQRITCSTVKHLLDSHLKNIQIPLIPIKAQEKVAQMLEKTDEIKQEREQANLLANKFLQAVFTQMFGDPNKNEKNLSAITINQLLERRYLIMHKDGNHGSLYPRSYEFTKEGVPFLTVKDIDENGQVRMSSVSRLNYEKAMQLKIGWIEKGDVLLAHNATVGKVGLYNGEFEKALIGTSLTAFRPNPQLMTSEYLFGALKSKMFQEQLSKIMKQTTRNQVPITAQRQFSLLLPSIESQREYSVLFKKVIALQSMQFESTEIIEVLFSSLMSKAFKGELVAETPTLS